MDNNDKNDAFLEKILDEEAGIFDHRDIVNIGKMIGERILNTSGTNEYTKGYLKGYEEGMKEMKAMALLAIREWLDDDGGEPLDSMPDAVSKMLDKYSQIHSSDGEG
jgi:hypothetical protein